MYHVPWRAFFSANRWRFDVLTFLIKGFAFYYRHPSLPQKNSIFEPNVKQNTYSRLLYTIMIFSGTFFLIGTGYWKESWPWIFLIFKVLSFQDPWMTIRDLSKAQFVKNKFVMQSKQIVSLNYLSKHHQLWFPYFKYSKFSYI